jgi:hypothetical protein
MTLDEQMTELTRMSSVRILYWARPAVVVLSAGLVLAGTFTGNPVFYGIALAFALIAFAIWNTTPHISNAARGLREGMKQNGDVEIGIHQWTDAESNQCESYNGLILMDNQTLWQMEFVQPQNWQPKEGRYPAELVFIRVVEWPVVLLTSDGLLYPRLKPRRVPGGQR